MLTSDQARYLERFSNGGDFGDDEDAFFEALKDLSTTEELYYLVQILNWDDFKTEGALWWILDHQKCDTGTALQIYWMNNPQDVKEAELQQRLRPRHKRTLELLNEIEKRYLKGKFKSDIISFDPRKERYLLEPPSAESEAVRAIPAELKKPTIGIELGEFLDHYQDQL